MNKIIMFIKNNKIKVIVSFCLVLVAAVLTVSYAYLGDQIDASQITNINATVGDMEKFVFNPGAELTLSGGSSGFTGTSSPSVQLIAGTDQTTIDSTYNVYFRVLQNGFKYTTETNTAELILTITDNTGTEITEIDGLNYTTVEGVSGFDVTTYKSFVTVKNTHPISTNNTTTGVTHNWTFTLTYIDLVNDQTENNGKTFQGQVIMTNGSYKDELDNLILSQNGGADYIKNKLYNVIKMPTTQELFDAMDNATQINYTVENGMYAAEDDYGTSYFFRGTVDNNWVYFAGYYWRVVRVNGDGSVRMIYSGLTTPTEATSEIMTGEIVATTNSIQKFNSGANLITVGYMYTAGEHQGLNNSSEIKIKVDDWYVKNLKYYEKYISDSIYCGDRNLAPGSSFEGNDYKFAAAARVGGEIPIGQAINPTFKCTNIIDSYTVDNVEKGNGALTYPIALLTADELTYAGQRFNHPHSSYYLFSGINYWTMTPLSYNNVFAANYKGISNFNYDVQSFYYVRPVISLKSDVLAKGTGTWYDPYVVETI